ncbi:MAG: hypothetical protein J5534_10305 [Fibrobacter sp.]|nr:hypothetical protein [Fibrobacter sp.]
MKKYAVISSFFVLAFCAGCSTVKFSPTQNITQTCPSSASSNSESKEKQCCLKDTLNITVNPVVETCKPDSGKDNAGEFSNIEVSPKFKYSPKKSLNINGKANVQNQEVKDFGTGCFGQNCKINKFFFDNKSEIKINSIQNNDDQSKKDHSASLEEFLSYHFIFLACLLIVLIIEQLFIYYKSTKKKSKENKSNNSYPFEILSPYVNKEILSQPTKDQLNFSIIENTQIKNIAITGPYGSGKSSIWESYCEGATLREKKNIIQISFANFSNNQSHYKNDNFTEYEIERVIIQQLVYSKENKDLKYSSFQKINDLPNYKISALAFLYLFLFSTITFTLAATAYPDTVESILQYITQLYTSNELYKNIVAVCCPTIIYCFLFYITFWIIQKANKIKISKFCINNIELTFDEKNSLFDKYLNEIVYFFEASKTNLVVIEDLDRFDTSLKIFTKLRELNTLINSYPPTKDSVKFVYLIRDDVLSKYERTKFFDFIIPVIPKLSVNNSASILKEEIDNLNKQKNSDIIKLDQYYLMCIQDYLKDFRLVKNCINEFFIYRDEFNNITKNKSEINKDSNNEEAPSNENIFDKKIFSLVLYKNLYPKDFSKLEKNEGVLFKCISEIHKILGIKEDEKSLNKSIKKTLTIYNNINSRAKFKTKIEILNSHLGYNETDRVDDKILWTLLINGYIENDYEMFIKKHNEAILNYPEQKFLLNVKNDIPASQNLSLRQGNLELISEQMLNHQWNSPGILNNTFIDFILEETEKRNNKEKNENETSITESTKDLKIEGIVEAIYSYDSKQSEKFFPQYYRHCKSTNIDIKLLLAKITIILESKNKNDSMNILECFFTNNDVNLFLLYLKTIDFDATTFDTLSAIGFFIDNDSNKSFKNDLFEKSSIIDDFIDIMGSNGIRITLTPQICKKLIKHGKISSSIYKISKYNFDLILTELNLSTKENYYLTRCLQTKELRDRILNTTPTSTLGFFNKILFDFNDVDEDYLILKVFFESNNKSKNHISTERRSDYISRIPPKWEKFVIYNRYVSFDEYLSESLKEFILSNSSNQEISESLQKDETGIKEFVRAVIKNSNIDNNVLLQKFLPFWKEYIPIILNCYKGYEEELQGLSLDKNHLLQTYAIQNEKIYFDQIMFLLVTKDPDFFENKYPEEEFAKENEFQLMILESEEKNLDNLKKHFFKEIAICPTDEENPRRYKAYKKFGLVQKKTSIQNFLFLDDIVKTMHKVFDPIKNINLKSFNNSIMHPALNISDNFDRLTPLTDDPWSILLFRTLKYWYQELCRYVSFNTFPYGNDMQGLKEIEKIDEKIVNERNSDYQNLVKKVEFWVNELDEYIKDFK